MMFFRTRSLTMGSTDSDEVDVDDMVRVEEDFCHLANKPVLDDWDEATEDATEGERDAMVRTTDETE
jgi:hypothetical protein